MLSTSLKSNGAAAAVAGVAMMTNAASDDSKRFIIRAYQGWSGYLALAFSFQ